MAPYDSEMKKYKIVKETWQIQVPALYAMGACAFLTYAIDIGAIWETIKGTADTKSYDTMVLITCRDEEQCDTILAAAEKAKYTLEAQ